MKKHNKVLLASAGLMAGLTAAAAAGAGPVVGVSAAVIGIFGPGLLIDKVKEYYKDSKEKMQSSDRADVLRARYPEIYNSDGSPKGRDSDSTPKGGDR
jgi:ammonia channel protein AmtB